MPDTIDSRLAAVDVAATQAASAQAAYLAAKATSDSLSVAAQIAANAVMHARNYVVAGLIELGKPAIMANSDGSDSVVELGGIDYTIRVLGDASLPLPASNS